MASETIRET